VKQMGFQPGTFCPQLNHLTSHLATSHFSSKYQIGEWRMRPSCSTVYCKFYTEFKQKLFNEQKNIMQNAYIFNSPADKGKAVE